MMIVVVAIIIILVIILLAATTTTLRRVIQLPPRLPPRLSFLVEPALLRAQLSVPAQIRFLPVRLPILPALIRRRPAFHRPSTPIPAFASIDAAFPEPRVPGFRIDTFHLFRVFCNIRREDAIWSVSVYRCRVVLRGNEESLKEFKERKRELTRCSLTTPQHTKAKNPKYRTFIYVDVDVQFARYAGISLRRFKLLRHFLQNVLGRSVVVLIVLGERVVRFIERTTAT